ncbi:lysosomal/endosomal membrane protein p67 [Trypanosoma grayi]|uniref:lysosomal/endosomal membrane protein p67 n=1 Tax=Trypanosoma grayi TaxID=71804 RepID=UPI0004F494A4|nr:lysosomal/endosomal membrane protein p67 [Trypanosoma grayi]KEG06109.1 lysosomal/endosomal membrane protein p67 [Trypanosoma grayi]
MYARARIFERNHSGVVDLASMQRLMRYNNFRADPLSRIPNCTGAGVNNTCDPAFSAMLSIAARGDLNPPGNATQYGPLFRYVGRRDHGATDAKIATWSGMTRSSDSYTAYVINGPTNDQQPTFEWTEGIFDPMPPIDGLPKVFNFSFVTYTTVGPGTPSNNDRNKWIGVGVGAGAAVLVFIAVAILLVRSRREGKPLSEEEKALIQ